MTRVLVWHHESDTCMRADYVERVLDLFLDDIAGPEAGAPLRNVVDFGRGY